MRDVYEILAELRNHPDCLLVECWTKSDIVDELVDNLVNYYEELIDEEEEVYILNPDFPLTSTTQYIKNENYKPSETDYYDSIIAIDWFNLLEDDWDFFRERVNDYYGKLNELLSHYGNWDEDRPVPSIGLLNRSGSHWEGLNIPLFKKMDREIKLKKILDEEI